MDLDALLEPRGDDAPSGEDLEYDQAFTDMELAAQPGEEKQAGDQILAAEDPDFKDVTQKALVVLEQSHDLRAGVFMAHSELRLRGLPGFAEATSYLRGCLETYWDSCHPQLDAEDDDDPTMRINSIFALADPDTILRALRLAPLTDSRTFGRFSLRDIAVAEGEITAPAGMDSPPDSSSIGAAFQDTDSAHVQNLLKAAQTAREDVIAIEQKFSEETPGQGPDLDGLSKLLKQITTRLAAVVGEPEEAPEETDVAPDQAPSGAGAVAAGGGGAVGAINSPNDVHNAIDRIIAYYQRSEPSSPVPLILLRAKKLVSADFLTIVKDMAPNGMENVNHISGLEPEED